MLPPRTEFRGWFFLIFGCASFSGFFYVVIISNFLPPSDNALISAIQNDRPPRDGLCLGISTMTRKRR
ncbi:hypothetical protein RHGRI_014267 [Rhododendron griersonianum]|uniref:Uncharacterized protein n=1 Tax=Rhododendron griersonianum TaxID=479676 RepID=A0AAV6K8P4_9ERIC|nr:hypothetical protein RHGRI_014267 [Rhododendron griersonianum]